MVNWLTTIGYQGASAGSPLGRRGSNAPKGGVTFSMISKNPSLLNLNLNDYCFYNQATLNDESGVEDC